METNRRAASFSRRLSRLRATALPTRLLIAKARTGRGRGEAGTQETVIGPERVALAPLSSSKPERPRDLHFKLPGVAAPLGGVL